MKKLRASPALLVGILALVAVSVGLLSGLQPPAAQATDRRVFTIDGGGVDGAGSICPHGITFQGKKINDGQSTWNYLIENKDGMGCGTSHWTLTLCQGTPNALTAFKSGTGGVMVTGFDPPTGLKGVKWNDLPDDLTAPPGAKFTMTLNGDFVVDNNVTMAIKLGAGVIFGNIEGPACAAVDTGKMTVDADCEDPKNASKTIDSKGTFFVGNTFHVCVQAAGWPSGGASGYQVRLG